MSSDTKKTREEKKLLRIKQQDLERNEGCGLSFFRPDWLQNFATSKSFMVVYGLLGTVQAMSYIYFVAILSTIEKIFGIPSRTTGIMLSGNEVSQILLCLILSYVGGQRNRPVWLGWGVAFSALSCFILALPHFIYGPGEQALSITKEYIAEHGSNQTLINLKERMGLCSEERSSKDCDNMRDYSIVPPLLVFLSQFILGIGTTLYYSLGQTYIDDNTKKTNTPLVLGLTMALRTIGPCVGFFVGYLCLSIYVDPSLTPVVDKNDPRWVGAWWLGWLVMGTVMFLFAFLVAMFPKHLPAKKNKVCDKEIVKKLEEAKPPTLKEFPTALKRLLKNKLLVINIFSGIFYILGASGYITYSNKYIEIQFEKSAASASIVLGPSILFSMVLGFLISGYLISKFKPGPKYLLGWNVFVGFICVIGQISLLFISCDDANLFGYDVQARKVEVNNSCNMGCGCENLQYSPVCMEERLLTFYSACHAGCNTIIKGDTKMYANCTCIPVLNSDQFEVYDGVLKNGACPTPCGHNFKLFIAVTSMLQLLGGSGKIGNILANYRAVLPEDKSFAQGFSLLLISLLAFIPGPIIFGSIIDASCLIWNSSCGEKGNCWFYDRHAFRHSLNTTAFVLTSIGVLLDIAVCYLGRNLNLYEDEKPPENGQIKTSSM